MCGSGSRDTGPPCAPKSIERSFERSTVLLCMVVELKSIDRSLCRLLLSVAETETHNRIASLSPSSSMIIEHSLSSFPTYLRPPSTHTQNHSISTRKHMASEKSLHYALLEELAAVSASKDGALDAAVQSLRWVRVCSGV